ncbi:hypothetical protein [Planococcus lenghuensis]|uniref:Lipoprotein n=1 Tax=Planococcus lenghuensis TaxID=2213202 RepID=A0A1Q2L0Q0_9BACL|nr:hypothetical protein [Planococcus lenghuensis]AQQ53472.1 hypothetical protein B0X71_10565 [Planococcus lenghuensis]
MRKKSIAIMLAGFLAACSNEEVRRVGIVETKTEEAVMITEEQTVEDINNVIRELEWQDGDPGIGNEPPEYEVTLFIERDEDLPEQLNEFSVWVIHLGIGPAGIIVEEETGNAAELEQAEVQVFINAFTAYNLMTVPAENHSKAAAGQQNRLGGEMLLTEWKKKPPFETSESLCLGIFI